jgi:Fe-S-cluster containining protein
MTRQANPCCDNDCHLCCINTRMTLTEADVALLEAAGRRRFSFLNEDRVPQLRNVSGHCVFLVEGRCSVYEQRPEGCRLYPLILDLDLDRVVRDDFCPFADEFEFIGDDEERLRRSVADEEREAMGRIEEHG